MFCWDALRWDILIFSFENSVCLLFMTSGVPVIKLIRWFVLFTDSEFVDVCSSNSSTLKIWSKQVFLFICTESLLEILFAKI